MQTLIGHFAANKVSLMIARDEFRKVAAAKKEQTGSTALCREEYLDEFVTLDTCHDLQYLTWVIQEALRI